MITFISSISKEEKHLFQWRSKNFTLAADKEMVKETMGFHINRADNSFNIDSKPYVTR